MELFCFSVCLLFFFHFLFFCEGTTEGFNSKTPDVSSRRIPTEATAASQVNQKYVVIGCSVFGGVLALLIMTLIIKIVSRAKVTPSSSGNNPQQGSTLQGDENLPLELLALPSKM